jgi:hypothetical protein
MTTGEDEMLFSMQTVSAAAALEGLTTVIA